MTIDLFPDLATPANRQYQLLGQCVDHGNTQTVQTPGNLVGAVVELTTGMQNGHDHFGSRYTFFMEINRDTTTVITHGDGFVDMDGDGDIGAMASQGLVDGVIHHLEHHVMQAGAGVSVTNVHTRTLAHRVEAFKYFDTGRIVRVVFAHAVTPEGPWTWAIVPCSTSNIETGVSSRQPSRNRFESSQVIKTWQFSCSSKLHNASRWISNSSDGKSSTK